MGMDACTLCPRMCGVNRAAGEKGYCGMDATIRAARAALHMWEEPCISGTEGSGAVFFSGCTLRCVFCQNHEIAAGAVGKPVTEERLSRIFLELQEKGANNINLVTATQFLPTVIPALQHAKKMGLTIPIVYTPVAMKRWKHCAFWKNWWISGFRTANIGVQNLRHAIPVRRIIRRR